MGAVTTPRPTRSGQQTPPQKFTLADISSKTRKLPNRYILTAQEGWGKTSFGAMTPRPVFLMTRQETGLETLIDSGRLPEVPHFPEVTTWTELLEAIDVLRNQTHEYKTLVLDTLNGAERLCHEHVCMREYGGEWGNKGFGSYQAGYKVSLADWRELLTRFDALRAEKQMAVVALSHTKIVTFKSPDTADFDRYQAALHPETWAITHQWADAVLFGYFETVVDAQKGASKGKAAGGTFRMMRTERTATIDAKNRMGLPAEIEMGNSAAEAWTAFTNALRAGKTPVGDKGEQANG